MVECPNLLILSSIESSLDRLNEAAWSIRMMEDNYHQADQFRWSLNSFLRVIKEVIQILTMELQNKPEILECFKIEKARIHEDSFMKNLFKQRDFVVHQSMLKPASSGSVGFTRGKGLKLGIGMPINPLEDSREAILKYIQHVATDKDFLGILYTEDDGGGEYTCVQREWRLDILPEHEIIELSASAWQVVGDIVYEVASRLGADIIKPEFELADKNKFQFEIYHPDWIKEQLALAKTTLL